MSPRVASRPPFGSSSQLATRRRLFVERLEDRFLLAVFEVWTIDQSNTTVDGGGTLYIYEGDELTGRDAAAAVPEVVDLGGAARTVAVEQTGTAPARPHMMMFDSQHTRAIVAYVATGHVLFFDAVTRTPFKAIDVGAQAHAAFPAPDDSYVIVANQNGKLLQRINTDMDGDGVRMEDADDIALDNLATIDLAALQIPGVRPDNAPICPIVDATGQFTFVTLRGGGMYVVDSTTTPMSIVAEYDRDTIHHDGCGGVELGGKMYINSGGPGEHDLYRFVVGDFLSASGEPNSPAPHLVYSQDGGQVDSHGAMLTKNGHYLWVADRWANKVVIVDTTTDTVSGEISLVGAASSDPAPDLMDISPNGNRMFVALRGPTPLTGNNPAFNNAVGSTPGVGIIRVENGGRNGVLQAVAPITHIVGGIERADPHALRIRILPDSEPEFASSSITVALASAAPMAHVTSPSAGEAEPPLELISAPCENLALDKYFAILAGTIAAGLADDRDDIDPAADAADETDELILALADDSQ